MLKSKRSSNSADPCVNVCGDSGTAASGDAAFAAAQQRADARFRTLTAAAVLLIAFLYGIVAGLRSEVQPVHAALQYAASAHNSLPVELPVPVPSGVSMTLMGNDARLNGNPVTMVHFTSQRGVKEVLADQVRLWEQEGLLAVGKTTSQRGIAIAMDHAAGERYVMTAWRLPESVRDQLNGASAPVEGVLARAPIRQEVHGENELVPGVPLRRGGKAGAVFSAEDPGGRSYTSTYTNPGTVRENILFYRAELARHGWNYQSDPAAGVAKFTRGDREVVLLLVPRPSQQDSLRAYTFITVTSRPQISMITGTGE